MVIERMFDVNAVLGRLLGRLADKKTGVPKRPFAVLLPSVVLAGALLAGACAVAGAAPAASAAATPSEPPVRLSFVPHAVFFSLTSRQASAVDPEVFVAASGAPAGLGFEQIAHAAGERSAEMMDDGNAQALDASARPLGFDLLHWFSANGVVQIDPPQIDRNGAQSVIVRFANLVPKARYSMFLVRLDARSATFTPLDGNGKTNSFTSDADGAGGATVVTPQALAHGSVMLLVYHADRKDHGTKAGSLGFDAFHQLAVHVP